MASCHIRQPYELDENTVYLFEADYRRMQSLARQRQRPTAELRREAIPEYARLNGGRPAPRSVGLGHRGRGNVAKRAEEFLEGMGRELGKRYRAPAKGLARKHTARDLVLLAELDALHNTLSGPATKCLMQRAVGLFDDTRYERLASISVSHLYNLRRARGYTAHRQHWTKTRGHGVPIGQRRAPAPLGRHLRRSRSNRHRRQ